MSSSQSEAPAEAGGALRELVAALARAKQALGFQYAAWCSRAPSIEANIALAGMAQEELGHAAALAAVLGEVPDKDAVVTWAHWGEAAGGWIDAWPKMILACLAREATMTAALEALESCGHAPLAQRAKKMVQEERFHLTFCVESARALASGTALAGRWRRALREAEDEVGGGEALARLVAAGALPADAEQARSRFLETLEQRLGAA